MTFWFHLDFHGKKSQIKTRGRWNLRRLMDKLSWIPLVRVPIKMVLREPSSFKTRTGPSIPSYIGMGLYWCGFSIWTQSGSGAIDRCFTSLWLTDFVQNKSFFYHLGDPAEGVLLMRELKWKQKLCENDWLERRASGPFGQETGPCVKDPGHYISHAVASGLDVHM